MKEIIDRMLDHTVDIVAISGISATAYHGVASQTVVAGIVTIALGKRAVDKYRERKAE